MTREEILHGLKNIAAGEGLYDDRKPSRRALILGEAIKAIEQETYVSIPYLMHQEMDIPISECQKAYDVAIEYLKRTARVKG